MNRALPFFDKTDNITPIGELITDTEERKFYFYLGKLSRKFPELAGMEYSPANYEYLLQNFKAYCQIEYKVKNRTAREITNELGGTHSQKVNKLFFKIFGSKGMGHGGRRKNSGNRRKKQNIPLQSAIYFAHASGLILWGRGGKVRLP